MPPKKSKNPRLPPAPGYDLEAGAPSALMNGEEPTRSPLKKKSSKPRRDSVPGHRKTYSSGSTRGAFYPHGAIGGQPQPPTAAQYNRDMVAHSGPPKKRHSKRNSNKHDAIPSQVLGGPAQSMPMYPPNGRTTSNSNNNMGTGSDLGDVASMAIAGLGDINMAELMGGAPPPPNASRPPQNRRARQSPPTTNGAPLETIPDSSDHGHYTGSSNNNVTPTYQRRTSNDPFDTSTPSSHRSMSDQQYNMYGKVQRGGGGRDNRRESVDSLRVSGASTDLTDDVRMFQNGMDRDNSMYVSSDSYAVPDFTQSDRTSLAGSQILDKRSSNSLLNNQTPPYRRGTNNQLPYPPSAPPSHKPQLSALSEASNQQEEIANFAAMLHADYGASANSGGGGEPSPQVVERKNHPLSRSQGPPPRAPMAPPPPKMVEQQQQGPPFSSKPPQYIGTSTEEEMSEESMEEVEHRRSMLLDWLDPTNWLTKDVQFENGVPFFDDSKWSIAGFVRHLFFNPIQPEFTSLQQFCWACIIGVFMGFYTAFWKTIIERSVEFMWKDIPETLLDWGLFTDLHGHFPLYHYMWICPAFWGGVLSYIFVILPTPIPGQNEWIQGVHTQGIQSHETFFLLFVLATLGMASGLSLGPELPLILTSGMLGSMLAIQCKQSILQARVMNITAASAAIGGFFGFPMAGALFVMEIPHRMGLQYFEALSPATIASIVAVLCNRLVTGNDVTGYYSYPFLTKTLPSEIFTSAIVFGVFGAFVGTCYTNIVLQLKGLVHDLFHAPHDDHHADEEDGHAESASGHSTPEENTPLVKKQSSSAKTQPPPELPFHQKAVKTLQKYFCCVIPHEPYRAAASGVVSGALVGVICMFVPHVMFWGEAQLQTLIDKGRTPLPVFGEEGEPTNALIHLGYCLIDPEDGAAVRAGFGIGCSFVITAAKIITTGLSLGTGIIGGHFWGPLFAGCAASHFLTDAVKLIYTHTGFLGSLSAYPCVTILCTMGSTHVVTFRAHTAIMLILTLTISAFDPEDGGNSNMGVAGDYSAVFPLLVISVFVSLMLTRQTVFYGTQRSRGDIMALPEVLCEPGKEGMPMVLDYEQEDLAEDEEESDFSSDEGYQSDRDVVSPRRASFEKRGQSPSQSRGQSPSRDVITQDAIERSFNAMNSTNEASPTPPLPPQDPVRGGRSRGGSRERANSQESKPRSRGVSPLPPRPQERGKQTISGPPSSTGADAGGGEGDLGKLSSSRLDELLSKPIDYQRPTKARHRRIQSAPNADFTTSKPKRFARERANSSFNNGEDSGSVAGSDGGGSASASGRHLRADSYGSQASGPLMRVTSFGHLTAEQPSLMDQARLRSATSVIVESRHHRVPSMPTRLPRSRGHSRQNSASSLGPANSGIPTGPPLSVAVATADRNAVPASEVERAYSSAVNQQLIGKEHRTGDGSNRGSPIPPEGRNMG